MRFKENEGVFKIKQDKISKEIEKANTFIDENDTLFYDDVGDVHKTEESAKFVTAKCLKKNGQRMYYVLVTARNKMYEISGSAFNYHSKKQAMLTGLDKFKLQKTNMTCFDSFISYLKTKNPSFLRIAQRNL